MKIFAVTYRNPDDSGLFGLFSSHELAVTTLKEHGYRDLYENPSNEFHKPYGGGGWDDDPIRVDFDHAVVSEQDYSSLEDLR